jgi:hypothetical protein
MGYCHRPNPNVFHLPDLPDLGVAYPVLPYRSVLDEHQTVYLERSQESHPLSLNWFTGPFLISAPGPPDPPGEHWSYPGNGFATHA